jgi:hypothetical protein
VHNPPGARSKKDQVDWEQSDVVAQDRQRRDGPRQVINVPIREESHQDQASDQRRLLNITQQSVQDTEKDSRTQHCDQERSYYDRRIDIVYVHHPHEKQWINSKQDVEPRYLLKCFLHYHLYRSGFAERFSIMKDFVFHGFADYCTPFEILAALGVLL